MTGGAVLKELQTWLNVSSGLTNMLEFLALVLAGLHFGVPLAYYWYARAKWLSKLWNIKIDENYRPKVTIILPTYNELEFIEKKLDDLYAQDYPKNLMETVIVDSGSDDGTVDIAEKWAKKHSDFEMKIVWESVRKGKLHALNTALKHVDSATEVIVFTDADAFWDEMTLSKAVRYFSNPKVGAVTSNISYIGFNVALNENEYRDYYNVLRIAESKAFATPIHNGPFLAIKARLLKEVGLPDFPGSDDSSFGSFIAFMGYRAIQVDDIWVMEPLRGSQFRRKVRRAGTLLSNFFETKSYAKKLGVYTKSPFEKIWRVEWWLHVVNPWLLVGCLAFLLMSIIQGSIVALALLLTGVASLALKVYRMWILQQVYILLAAIKNLWTKEIMWSK